MKEWYSPNRIAALVTVLGCAAAIKLYYSTASVNDLRWVLAPTAFLVELATGESFEFESYAGYMSSDHSFLIAASCSGVNFLTTAFLMLSIGRLWRGKSPIWRYLPIAMMIAYATTIVANAVRISTAMEMRSLGPEVIWLNPDQLHRFEGIYIYFGFLLLLFCLSDRLGPADTPPRVTEPSLFRRYAPPLLIYWTTTLAIPLATGAYRQGAGFWEHSLFVLLTPLLLILPLTAFRFIRDRAFVTAPVERQS